MTRFMRYLVLSDIHANYLALEAVLRHAEKQKWESVIFLGDAVGYYTQPEEVTTALRELKPEVALLGNHEAVLLELAEGRSSSMVGDEGIVAEVLERHLKELSAESLGFLGTLSYHVVKDGWEAAHGALRTPWEYLSSLPIAQSNLEHMQTNLCFVGHTHVPLVYACVSSSKGELWRTVTFRNERNIYRIPPAARVFFNPGSVGQPRDGIPLASYAVFDDSLRVIELFRVPFDLVGMQRLVRQHNYNEALAARLAVGR